MNAILRIMRMPWLATVRTRQIWLWLFIGLIWALNVSKALPMHGVARQLGTAVLIVVVVATWKMASNTLWLAREARGLRLPSVEHDADYALALYALASVLLPAAILCVEFGHVVVWLVSLGLLAMAVLAFCTLPAGIALPLLAAAVAVAVFPGWRPPLPGDPGFLAWAVPALIVLTVAALQRWIALRRAASFGTTGWLRPTALGGRLVQLRKLRGSAVSSPAFDAAMPRKVTRRRTDELGPTFRVRSLRTTLSAALAPYDVLMDHRHWRRWQVGIVALLALALIALLAGHRLVAQRQPLLLVIVIVLIIPMGRRATADAWREGASGLPLLALLPHLGAAAHVRRDTVAACVVRTAWTKLGLAAFAAVAMIVLHWPPVAFVYLALMLACGLLLELAIAANVIGGCPLPVWLGYALYFSVILVPVSAMQLLISHRQHAHAWLAASGWQLAVCIGLWLAWCLGFAVLALRGWRALQRRPHPFLPIPGQ
jgi:hypothetical protein